jgi:hypothetical protein
MKNNKHANMNGKKHSGLNNNKRQFLEAVKLMAPGNKFIAEVARRVPQDMLPAIAGVAAFELTSTLELLCKSWRLRRPLETAHKVRRSRWQSRTKFPLTPALSLRERENRRPIFGAEELSNAPQASFTH